MIYYRCGEEDRKSWGQLDWRISSKTQGRNGYQTSHKLWAVKQIFRTIAYRFSRLCR